MFGLALGYLPAWDGDVQPLPSVHSCTSSWSSKWPPFGHKSNPLTSRPYLPECCGLWNIDPLLILNPCQISSNFALEGACFCTSLWRIKKCSPCNVVPWFKPMVVHEPHHNKMGLRFELVAYVWRWFIVVRWTFSEWTKHLINISADSIPEACSLKTWHLGDFINLHTSKYNFIVVCSRHSCIIIVTLFYYQHLNMPHRCWLWSSPSWIRKKYFYL